MPGLQVASRYGGMEDVRIGIRGSASRGGVAPRGLAVLLDGIPLTEPDGVARLDLIELAAARQIEVVRGPVSALYAGSPGGVVNVVSRTGRDSRGISVSCPAWRLRVPKVRRHRRRRVRGRARQRVRRGLVHQRGRLPGATVTVTSSGAKSHSTMSPHPVPGSSSRPPAPVSTRGCRAPRPSHSSTRIPTRRRRRL